MGITGLIPFLEKASKRGNINQFAGQTVAIDSYCWLHKGAFSCADKIVMGQPTDAHVKYCMKFVHMLLANRIKPIMVFDGRHLPAKRETEVKRRESRESTRRRAAELMRMGQTAEGRNLLRRSVDITHEIALQLIKTCQEENVDCIVAPYEADAELAYLNITGIADVVITEDSDLTLFGCKKIFFKMDINGNGLLVEQDRLHLAMNLPAEHFEIDKFRHMCILSGCDYLASLPGIGLSKACKFVLKNREDDIHKALGRLGAYLNMKALVVTNEYRDAFIRALITFKHQLVFCPLRRKQVRLSSPSPEVTEEQLHFAGDEIDEDVAYQMALGNYDPFTVKKLHDYDPDRAQKRASRTNAWHEKPSKSCPSIWSRDFKVSEEKENKKTSQFTKWPDTSGQIAILNTDTIKRKTTPKKRNFEELAEEISENEALQLYGSKKMQKHEVTADGLAAPPLDRESSSCSDNEITKSPILSKRPNPFATVKENTRVSPSLVTRGKRRIKLKNLVGFRQTVIDDNTVKASKYFNSNSGMNDSKKKETNGIDECLRIVIDAEENVREKFIEMDESEDYRETNVIEDAQTQAKVPNSSGFFSRDSDDRKNSALELDEINEIHSDAETKGISGNREPEMPINVHSYDSHEFLETPRDTENCLNNVVQFSSAETKENARKSDAALRCSFYKWANTKDNSKIGMKTAPARNKPIVTAEIKTAKKITSRIKSSVESQQTLLNMFGFQKKPVLKR